RLIASIIRGLLRQEDVTLTSGRQVRDFLDTRDVGAALAALAHHDAITGPINVASGRATSIRAVAEIIAHQCGRSPSLLKFGALPDRKGDPPYLVADVARLSQTGFAPAVSFQSRLAQCIAWHDADMRRA